MKTNNAQELEKAIRLTYDSLQSHLPYTYGKSKDGVVFHQKCVNEYARIILTLTQQYKKVKRNEKAKAQPSRSKNNPS